MFYIAEIVIKLLIKIFNVLFDIIEVIVWKFKAYPRIIVDKVELEYLKYLTKEEDDFQAVDKALNLLIERTKF